MNCDKFRRSESISYLLFPRVELTVSFSLYIHGFQKGFVNSKRTRGKWKNERSMKIPSGSRSYRTHSSRRLAMNFPRSFPIFSVFFVAPFDEVTFGKLISIIESLVHSFDGQNTTPPLSCRDEDQTPNGPSYLESDDQTFWVWGFQPVFIRRIKAISRRLIFEPVFDSYRSWKSSNFCPRTNGKSTNIARRQILETSFPSKPHSALLVPRVYTPMYRQSECIHSLNRFILQVLTYIPSFTYKILPKFVR